jgi:non-specific serine/threonine protein kinase
MIGETVSHYRILAELGAGGMGVVYRAEDINLKRPVALKFLPPESTRNPEAKARFIHEAQAASALDHANICTIYEIDETDDGRLFIAMACYEGETLKERIGKGPVPLDEAVDITRQIAQGLAEAHERGIVHRDIKPANVFLTKSGQVKIVDFGLAKLAGQTKLTKTGSTMGTVAYMSPEQAEGQEVDQRADLWSLGALLYEMTTGQLPFQGDHEQAVIYSILNKPPADPSTLEPGIPADVEYVTTRALAKPRDERYQSAKDMLADLRRAQQVIRGEEVPRPRERAGRSKIGGRTIILVALAAVAVMAGLYYLVIRDRPAQVSVSELPSVAVLYLENLSADQEKDYFAAGMTEDIITALAGLEGLRVATRSDVVRYRDSDEDIADIARKLEVDYILTGSVRFAGSQLRVNGQLVRMHDGVHVWADRYDRQLEDVFAVQADVAEAIAQALAVTLKPAERERIQRKPTTSLEAYELVLRGRQYYNQRSPSDNLLAIDLFEQAVALDSLFADAYTWLAQACLQRLDWRFARDREKWSRKAEPLIQKAIALDPQNADAYEALGIFHRLRSEYQEAAKAMNQAAALRPTDPRLLRAAGLVQYFLSDYQKAIAYHERALALRRSNPEPHRELGRVYMAMGEPDSAESHYQRAVELGPDSAHLHYFLGSFCMSRGRFNEAEKHLRTADLMKPGGMYRGVLGRLALLRGQPDKARADFLSLDESHANDRRYLLALGISYELLGDTLLAFNAFERALAEVKRNIEHHPRWLNSHIDGTFLSAKLGRMNEARTILAKAEKVAIIMSQHERAVRNRLPFARAYLAVGDTAAALAKVEQAVRDNMYAPRYISVYPGLESLRAHPEFQRLLAADSR